jgi:hypothetical protein
MLLVVPLSLALATPVSAPSPVAVREQQTFKHALSEAFGHRSYVLLVIGFFTCGFQLAFTTVHLPAYLVDRGLPVQTGGWVIATIGLFNIVGSLSVGWLQSRLPKRYILSTIYFVRGDVDRGVHLVPDHDVLRGRLRRRYRPDLAVDDTADLKPRGADVRNALAGDAVRFCVFQPSGRWFPGRAARRHRVR